MIRIYRLQTISLIFCVFHSSSIGIKSASQSNYSIFQADHYRHLQCSQNSNRHITYFLNNRPDSLQKRLHIKRRQNNLVGLDQFLNPMGKQVLMDYVIGHSAYVLGQFFNQQSDRLKRIEQLVRLLSSDFLNNQYSFLTATYNLIVYKESYRKIVYLLIKRMSIPQILSYREQHKIKTLQQQILSLKTTVQIKSKQIFFLSTQIVSLKQQNTHKEHMLQLQISQNKKQIIELRKRVAKTSSISSDLVDKQILQMKKSYQMKLQNQKQNYERIISGLKRKFEQEILMTGQKYQSKLIIQKKQVQGLKQIIEQNNRSNIGSVRAFSQQSKLLSLDKKQLQQQLQTYKASVDKAKRQFDRNIQEQNQITKKIEVQLSNAKATVESYAQKNKQLQKSLQFAENQFKMSQIQLQTEIKKLKHQNLQYQAIIKAKDQQFIKASCAQVRKVSPQKLTINHVRDCNHSNLIQQLEKSIGLLTRENAYLKKKIKDWGQQLGFQSSLQNRLDDVNCLSEKAVSTYNNFRSLLQNKAGKISKNKGKQ